MSHLPRFLPALVFLATVGAATPAHAAPSVIADPWYRDGDNAAGTSGSAADSPPPADIVGDRWYLDLDPAAVHQRYLDATNRGDVGAAVALFAQDAGYQAGTCHPTPSLPPVPIPGDLPANVS